LISIIQEKLQVNPGCWKECYRDLAEDEKENQKKIDYVKLSSINDLESENKDNKCKY
jgi:hypothetical protein